ncbi:hypothetical protein ABZ570_03440 [Micromonospora sp. NPDC007271]|uniref:hypothetical protein n=1 Tax=Micromonospora sp. NPDC007271 TaxID=3154587 RepID=UPI00340B7591
MRFTLTYDGLLTPDGTAKHKMEIRRHFHRQLAELWTHEPLTNIANAAEPDGVHYENIAGHGFTAVVHDAFKLRADLDVLLLREAAPGSVLSKADIDNQLKTLFDALTWPQQTQQVPEGWAPKDNEKPLHCLLQDDRHITRLRLETERWLAANGPQHVRLFIRVRVTNAYPTNASVLLGT